MLQRPLVTDDGKDPLTGELHLGKDLLGQVIAVAQVQIHLGDALVGLGDRHLDVVDKGAEERPLLVGSLELIKVTQLLAGGTQAVPSGQIDARLAPAEDPRNGTQVVERLGTQAALGGT